MQLSVVIPAHNEEECIESTVRETMGVLRNAGLVFEVLVVNDGSDDRTPEILGRLRAENRELRVLTLSPRSGQSAAFAAGLRAASGEMTVFMDSDGQNDPADIPAVLSELKHADVCCGWRRARRDPPARRAAGRLANAVRNLFLHDRIRDTGCSLKAFRTAAARGLPLELRGMHRFLPALFRMRGATIVEIPVNHRPRRGGRSKYSNAGRLRTTIGDLLAVRWMQKRLRRFKVEEMQ